MSVKNLGSKVRSQRRSRSLTQVELARRLGISPSYLNLIEHNQRPLTAELLIKLAAEFKLDFNDFVAAQDDRLVADVLELLSDPVFEDQSLNSAEIREAVSSTPALARAMLVLYGAYQAARDNAVNLADRMYDAQEGGGTAGAPSSLPSEEINDFIQRRMNHFPELEAAAEAFVAETGMKVGGRFAAMVGWLKERGIEVVIGRGDLGDGVVRRYDAVGQRVLLADNVPPSTRNFQLAAQVALMREPELLTRLARDAGLTDETAETLCRVVLANYFAGAVLMPYETFLNAANSERYDIELLQHRFGAGFEQICHRMTTLRRSGSEGVPMHMIRVDLAGNISKRFSASGIRFARFSGACPRWNVFSAFQTPGRIRVQISRMPDGEVFFCVARTVPRGSGGYHAPHTVQAVGMGCQIEHARALVYSDGIDLDALEGVIPVGVTCRLCDRQDCEQRVLPSLRGRLRVDEHVRTRSFFASVDGS